MGQIYLNHDWTAWIGYRLSQILSCMDQCCLFLNDDKFKILDHMHVALLLSSGSFQSPRGTHMAIIPVFRSRPLNQKGPNFGDKHHPYVTPQRVKILLHLMMEHTF